MTYLAPIPYKEALQSRAIRTALPTTGSSARLQRLPAAVLNRAVFSAKTNNAWYVSRIADVGDRLLQATASGRQLNKAYAMQALREALAQIGYHPGTAGIEPRSIQDFASDARIGLIADMSRDQAAGYGQALAGQDPVLLSAFPCQELYRQRDSRVKRPWPRIWSNAAGRTFGGRMIARKDDPIWVNISRFGNPYPPFDYNSGMWVRDVSRKLALSLGVPGLEQPVKPTVPDYNAGLRASASARHRDLLRQLLEDFGDLVSIDPKGTLIFKAQA